MVDVEKQSIPQLTPIGANDFDIPDKTAIPVSIQDPVTNEWKSRRAKISDFGGSSAALADTVTQIGTTGVKSSGIYAHVAAAVATFTPAWVRARQPGTILLIRDNAVVLDGGDNRVTKADYGNGFKQVLAAAQSGDKIICGPGELELVDAELAQSNVKMYLLGTQLKANNNHSYIFRSSGTDNEIHGLTVDGNATGLGGNTLPGWGISITNHRNRLFHCAANNTIGDTIAAGSGLHVLNSYEFWSTGFYSERAWYAGVLLDDSRNVVMRNTRIHNPLNRSFNIQGTQDINRVELDGFVATMLGMPPTSVANPGGNMNYTGTVSDFILKDVHIWSDPDMYLPGYTYDHTTGMQQLKMQNVKRVLMDNVTFDHGQNNQSYHYSWRFESPANGNNLTEQVILRNVRCAGNISFGDMTPDYMDWDNVHVCTRFAYAGVCMFTVRAKEWRCRRSTFNCHGGTRVMTSAVNHDPTWEWDFERNQFIGDKATDLYVIDGAYIKQSAGRFRFVKNKYINNGAGNFGVSNEENSSLTMTTNANGDMLWDQALIGTGIYKHPDPGAGPNYFPNLPIGPQGSIIWNIKKLTTGSSYPTAWMSDGTNWKSWIA